MVWRIKFVVNIKVTYIVGIILPQISGLIGTINIQSLSFLIN